MAAASYTHEQLLQLPAAEPPAGVTANFVDPWSMAYSAECALHTLYAVSTLMFFIKMYAQIRIERKMGPEDYVLAVAWVSRTTYRTVACLHSQDDQVLLTPPRYFTRGLLNPWETSLHGRLWVYTSGISHSERFLTTYSYVHFPPTLDVSFLTPSSTNTVF